MRMTPPVFFTTSILPVPAGLVLRGGGWSRQRLRVRVGYFHHPQLGHTLIDTGYSRHVVKEIKGDIYLSMYRMLLRPTTLTDEPLVDGLRRMGLTLDDIDTVIVTHFHADHIGGLLDLPGAKLVASKTAWDCLKATGRTKNAMEGVYPALLPDDIEARLTLIDDSGTDAVWLTDDGAVTAVALPGHLAGQIGVFFPKLETPLLYAADVQWSLDAIKQDRLPGFPANRIYHDKKAALASVGKVRAYLGDNVDVVLCHDWNRHPLDIDFDLEDGV